MSGSISSDDIERIAGAAARAAVQEMFIQLGVDTKDPIRMQRNFARLNGWVEGCETIQEKSWTTLIGIMTTGFLGAVVYFIRDHLPFK